MEQKLKEIDYVSNQYVPDAPDETEEIEEVAEGVVNQTQHFDDQLFGKNFADEDVSINIF